MDLIKLILNPDILKTTCFLCFNQKDDICSVYEVFEIHEKSFNYTSTLCEIIRDVFRNQDIILQHACSECVSLIMKIYILYKRNALKMQSLKTIVDKINENVSHLKINIKSNELRINISDKNSSNNHEEIANISPNIDEISKEKNRQTNCKDCDITLKSQEELEMHRQFAHTNTNDAVICDACGKVCNTPQSLKAHLNCHRQQQCPHCFKILKSHSHFKLHLKNHISPTKRKLRRTRYNCHHCGYTSLNKKSLEAHINKVHLLKRPFICKICDRGFYKESNLIEHMQIHIRVKKDMCEICGDSFASKKTLIEHLRLHSNEKPYQCDLCEKSFITSGRRTDHVKRTHLKKNEVCSVCHKKFSLKNDLNRHIKKVHWHSPEIQEHTPLCTTVNLLSTDNYVENNSELILLQPDVS